MTRLILMVLTLTTGLSVFAQQSSWKWPEDPEMDKLAKEKQAYYKIQMQTDQWQDALKALNWLYKNTPDLHESIYQDGSKIIDNLLLGSVPASRQAGLEDSLLWMYDQRITIFGDPDGSTLDRKAYMAFKMNYKKPEKFPMLISLYKQLYAKGPKAVSDFNIIPYMTVATYYYKSAPDKFKADDLLDVHLTISNVIDAQAAAGGDRAKLQDEQEKIDAFLTAADVLNCAYIENNLVSKFKAAPNDLSLAKKIISYSAKAKCTDQPYFMQASELLLQSEPTYTLAITLASKFYNSGDFQKADKFYQQAEQLTSSTDEKFDALMGQASCQSKLGNKSKARSIAYQALSIRPGAADAYNFIGNLYFLSYQTCREGKSQVQDRAVFLAAYEMYQKAGNSQQMQASKEQFPSIEEIFNEGMKEGEQLTVGCWINETVELRRR